MHTRGPLTGWESGARVRTTAKTTPGWRAWDTRPAGLVGRLYYCERVQEGQEVWTFWLDTTPSRLWAACHSQLELVT